MSKLKLIKESCRLIGRYYVELDGIRVAEVIYRHLENCIMKDYDALRFAASIAETLSNGEVEIEFLT